MRACVLLALPPDDSRFVTTKGIWRVQLPGHEAAPELKRGCGSSGRVALSASSPQARGCLAQWPEHEIADLAVTGSNPVVP